jgi:hypothetical protein
MYFKSHHMVIHDRSANSRLSRPIIYIPHFIVFTWLFSFHFRRARRLSSEVRVVIEHGDTHCKPS